MAFVTFSGNSKFNPQPKPEKADKQDNKKAATKKINQVSEKRKQENKIYKTLRSAFLFGKRCAVYPEDVATDVHHKKGRVGKLFLDTRYWLPVGRRGHKKIEENPKWAKEMGYSLNRL